LIRDKGYMVQVTRERIPNCK